MTRLTATEAARSFSEVLNRVAAGERIEITRAGRPVALFSPPPVAPLSGEAFDRLMQSLPRPDPDFAEDVRRARRDLPRAEDPWPS